MKKYTVEFIGTRTFLVANDKSLDDAVTRTLNVMPQQLKTTAKVVKIEDV
jgi:hypothetical protein